MKSKHNEEVIYEAVKLGLLTIDDQGRIWKVAELRGNRWGRAPTLRKVPRRRAEHDMGDYLQVRRMVNRKRTYALAHRLVWRHFHGSIPGDLTVNHRNGKKKDNIPTNLELATHREQTLHAMTVLGKFQRILNQNGEKNHASKLLDHEIKEMRERRARGETLQELALDYGVAFQTISKICRGDCWAHVT